MNGEMGKMFLFVGSAAIAGTALVHALFDAAFGDEAVLHRHQELV